VKFLSLFSGIEAVSAAWVPLGWVCVGFAEIESFPCAVLNHRYPNVKNLGDVTKITEEQIKSLGHIDVVAGGFPCQDLSVAGKRKGLKNADGTRTRSGLFFDAMRIAEWSKARYLLIENVPGLFSSNDKKDFAAVVGEMAGVFFDPPEDGWENTGCAIGPRGLVEWCVLDAQWFGVPQRRRRIFALRDSGNWFRRPPILFERQSLSWNSPPCRKKGQSIAADVAPSLTGSGRGIERTGESRGQDPVIAFDWQSGGDSRGIMPKQTAQLQRCQVPAIAHALPAEHDASEDGTGRGVPLVPDIAWALQERDSKGPDSDTKPGHLIPVAFQEAQTGCREYGISGTLRSNGPGHDPVGTRIRHGMQVRRLTPQECERLMNFPDGYTAIQYRGKPAADGARYKALGNSMVVSVVRWIGQRIQMLEDTLQAAGSR
jgi:DNA (cytosine-5)-methyltransferase 1